MIDARSSLCNGGGAYGAGPAFKAFSAISASRDKRDW
jgi:hypothetical protein